MSTTAAIVATLRAGHYRYGDEISLHLQLADRLEAAGIDFQREVQVAGGRIDFLAGDVGIEVKIKGSVDAVDRQLAGYAADAAISALLLATTRSQHRAVARSHGDVRVDVLVLGALV